MDGLLAIASTENLVYIKDFNPETNEFIEDTSLTVNSPSRCVSWSSLDQKLLATGLFNGNIIIFDLDTAKVKHVLHGSEFRIVCIQWHPQLEHIIAAASFDSTVHVYDLKQKTRNVLTLHTDRVRSVHWNSEIPWLLLSGGDDSKQILWDIRLN